MTKPITVTRDDLVAMKACEGGIKWFDATFPQGFTGTTSQAVEVCAGKVWLAWFLYIAGLRWSDKRYTPAIAKALIASGNGVCLYYAGRYWKDERKKDLEVAE